MATYLDAFKLGVEGHTPEANETRRQAAVVRLEQINSLGDARANDRAGASLVARHDGDLQKVVADDLFHPALADHMKVGAWPRPEAEVLEAIDAARDALESEEAIEYYNSPEYLQDAAQERETEARAQEAEERALDAAMAANEDYGIALQDAALQSPGAELTTEEVSSRLMKAYGAGTNQRLANTATMAAIMNGQQPDTGVLAQRQLNVMADIERARGFFPPSPGQLASEEGRGEYERAAVDALETALRGIGEWDGLSLPVAYEADYLFSCVGYFGAEHEDLEHLSEILPNLEQVREAIAYENGTLFRKEFADAERTAREYAVHQLKAAAGEPAPPPAPK
jgi:hypothetical protein